jgi:hypothetical protein
MIPERCTFCRGTLQEGKTEFIARVGDEIVIVRDAPTLMRQDSETYGQTG